MKTRAKKSATNGEVLLARASALISRLTSENAALARQLVERDAQHAADDHTLVLKAWGAHSRIVFVVSRADADDVLTHVQCGLIKVFGFDERRMAVKELTDHQGAVEFFGG